MTAFADKVVCVTGAGSGIGRRTAVRFAEQGAKVVIADVNEEGLQETATQIGGTGGVCEVRPADASKGVETEGLVASCLSTFGGLDVFFANAGIAGPIAPLNKTDDADILRVLEVNLLGPLFAVKYAAPVMAERGGGAIVMTASVAGINANAGPVPYSATKAGVINLAKSAAQELAGSGVRVNAVCPGLIETGMTQTVFDMARQRGTEGKLGYLNPSRRAGVPDDIAGVVLFLASDAASYVNGQALAVDGGLTSSMPFAPSNALSMV